MSEFFRVNLEQFLWKVEVLRLPQDYVVCKLGRLKWERLFVLVHKNVVFRRKTELFSSCTLAVRWARTLSVLLIFWANSALGQWRGKSIYRPFSFFPVTGRKSRGMLDCTQGAEVWASKRSRVCIFSRARAFVIATIVFGRRCWISHINRRYLISVMCHWKRVLPCVSVIKSFGILPFSPYLSFSRSSLSFSLLPVCSTLSGFTS